MLPTGGTCIQLTADTTQGYYGAATGKGRQSAKAELEKLDLASPSNKLKLTEAVKEAARIIYVAHEDSKDKEFELEMTWISGEAGPTKGRHEEVPKELFDAAVKAAQKAMPDYDDSEEEQSDGDGDQMQE